MSTLSSTSTADMPLPAGSVSDARAGIVRAILYGGLIAGVLDITDAVVTTYLLSPTPSAVRMLQGIASGLLGPSAFNGGLAAAAVGLACHFTIALGAAATYVLASRKLPILLRHPIVCGIAFGICVHLFMQNVVLPLSFIRMRTTPTPWPQLANQLFIHALGVGLPIALAARRWAFGRSS
jgi:uncharacterized membrane protein YagU involved in acid resistance